MICRLMRLRPTLCLSVGHEGWTCELAKGHGGDHGAGSPQLHSAEDADHRWSEPHDPIMAERNAVMLAFDEGMCIEEIPAHVGISASMTRWHLWRLGEL